MTHNETAMSIREAIDPIWHALAPFANVDEWGKFEDEVRNHADLLKAHLDRKSR